MPVGWTKIRSDFGPRRPWVQACLMGLLPVAMHGWLVAPILQNGDAAVYNEQIQQRLVGTRTTHVGYLLLGMVADTLLPFDVERNLNLMTLACAALGAVAAGQIARSRLSSLASFAAVASMLYLPTVGCVGQSCRSQL